jgi:hypothetical protein
LASRIGKTAKPRSHRARRNAWSDDTSWSIPKSETHLSDWLHVATGKSLLPYIVTSQNSSTVQEHLKKQGVRFARHFTLKFNQKLYFKRWHLHPLYQNHLLTMH